MKYPIVRSLNKTLYYKQFSILVHCIRHRVGSLFDGPPRFPPVYYRLLVKCGNTTDTHPTSPGNLLNRICVDNKCRRRKTNPPGNQLNGLGAIRRALSVNGRLLWGLCRRRGGGGRDQRPWPTAVRCESSGPWGPQNKSSDLCYRAADKLLKRRRHPVNPRCRFTTIPGSAAATPR
uniref:Uncharacterized protein n=1 Tax=Branchiostoma floridae TaxID=7739 RepID=C3ZLW2_BRAFL|eukprot:XP_002590432.1 hypothetical protein BRAFLDRAFT_109726 [Branchiostoma floridae]